MCLHELLEKATELMILLGSILVTVPAIKFSLEAKDFSKQVADIKSGKPTEYSKLHDELDPLLFTRLQAWKASDHWCLCVGLVLLVLASGVRLFM